VEILSEGQAIPDTMQVRLVEVDRSLNRIPRATLEILDGSPVESNFAISESDTFKPGAQIEIKAGYHGETEPIFKGIVLGQSLRIRDGRHSFLEVTCAPMAIKMTHGRKHAYFEQMKDSDIISQLLGNAGLSKEVEATTYQYPMVVQYQATDWDFMMTRAEANGMVVHVTDTKVEVKKPDVSGSPELVIMYGRDMVGIKLDVDAREQYGNVLTRSWDDSNMSMVESTSSEPSVNSQGNISGSNLAQVLGDPTYTWNTPATLPSEELKAWADARLLRARLSRIQGTVTFQGSAKAKPNSLIELAGLGARFNGNAFISGVRHVVKDANWVTHATLGLNQAWLFEQHQDVDDPAASVVLPSIQGLQVGVVQQIQEDPDGRHRIKVQIPTINTNESIWARMTHLYATNNAGSFFLPELGDEVLVGFLNQDPRNPVILGMLYNGQKAPPYTADEENTFKAFVSKNQLKIEFEDVKKILTLMTPAGNKIVMDEDQKTILIEDQNGNKLEMAESGITMESPKDINIKATGNISLEAQQGLTLKATQDLSGEGMNVTLKGQTGFKAEGSATAELKAGGQTTVKGAMVMIN